MAKQILARLVALALGCAAALLLLALALRLLGSFYNRPQKTPLPGPNGTQTILCAGDSYVYGLGATSRETAFPAALNGMLAAGGGNFSAVNMGVPGSNSSYLLQHLPAYLDRTRPAAVIILSGTNNSWNQAWRIGDSAFTTRLLGWLYRIPIYRFYAYAAECLRQPAHPLFTPEEWRSQNQTASRLLRQGIGDLKSKNYAKAENNFLKAIKLDRGNGNLYVALAQSRLRAGRKDQAVLAMIEGAEKATFSKGGIYRMLGWNFSSKGEHRAAAHWFEKSIESDMAENNSVRAKDTLVSLLYCYMKSGEQEQALKFLSAFPSMKEARQDMERYLKAADLDRKMELWLARDYALINDICSRAGAKLFIANYPYQDDFQALNRRISALAKELRVPLIDNEALFIGLKSENPAGYYDKYFVEDGHCNDLGYRLMAENAHKVLAGHGFK